MSQAEGWDRSGGSQATKGKATGREEKWDKEEGGGAEQGQMAVPSLGSGSKGGRQGEQGTESRRSDRVAQEEKEVEECSPDPAGKETERKRVRESWRKAMG